MKKLLLLFCLTIPVLFFTSCGEDEVGDTPEECLDSGILNLNLKGKYDGQTLVLNEAIDYPGMDIGNWTKVRLYISDIKLIHSEGEVLAGDVGYFDFSNNHSIPETAPNGEDYAYENVPTGIYSSIQFYVGLTPELNDGNTSDYAGTGSPLSLDDNWWPWRGYIFSQIEGFFEQDTSFYYPFLHCGPIGDLDMFFPVSLEADLAITEGETTTLPLELDLKNIFIKSDGSYLDLSNLDESTTHSNPGDEELVELILSNIADNLVVSE